jgi:hypothetical protein
MSQAGLLLRNVCWTCSNVSSSSLIRSGLTELLSDLGPTDPPEYSWMYGVPAIIFTGGFLAAASTGMAGLVQAGYLTSSILCIGILLSLKLRLFRFTMA